MHRSLRSLAALTLLSATALTASAQNLSGKWVTGYYAGYFWDNADYQAPQHVDLTAMTHMVFARIGPGGGARGGAPGEVLRGGGSSQTNPNVGPGAPVYTVEQYMVKRAHQVGTKALIMLGGEGDNDGFHASSVDSARAAFVKNLVDYMVAQDYDGIDVDWEGIPKSDTEDQLLLEKLIADLRAEANARPRYQDRPVIITYPAGMLNPNIDQVTPHDLRVAALVDQYNFMSYGMGWFGSGWKSTTFAPLTDGGEGRPMSIAGTVQAYVDAGVPRAKLGMGIGFYGMNYAPPFNQPGMATDGYDLGTHWSVLDYKWSYALLKKYGYLDNGAYVYEQSTQNSFRTYPGGFAPRTGEMATGYLSYEDEASIAAKGAWTLSARDGEGAGGTIIWLVNYGTTDGVNNPLLLAVKRAFLDPNATDPGPNPNPLPIPPAQVSAQLSVTSDWTSGYCGKLVVTDVGTLPGEWKVALPFKDTITSLWNGAYTLADSTLTVTGPAWNKYIYPGQSTEIGFCATRPVSAPAPAPAPEPGALSAKVTITTDWTSGYCASIAVTNSGSTAAVGWSLPVPVDGKVSSLWNGTWTQSGSTLTLSGPSWSKDLAAGGTYKDAGFCASR
jgi:GH18 family chitinase